MTSLQSNATYYQRTISHLVRRGGPIKQSLLKSQNHIYTIRD